MLGDNYIKLNNIYLPNPQDGITIAYQNIETVGQAESGVDLVTVTRLKKKTWSWTAYATSEWLAQYEYLCGLSQCTLTLGGNTYTVRARLGQATMSPSSEYADRTEGLWSITIQLIEV